MPISDEYPQVEVLFRAYLDTHKHRKTPERFAVLEEIYTLGEHFDVERLYTALKDRGYSGLYTINVKLDSKSFIKSFAIAR